MTKKEYRAAALYVLQCALTKTTPALGALSMLDVSELTCDPIMEPLKPLRESEVFCLKMFAPVSTAEHDGRTYGLYEPRAQFGVLERSTGKETHGVD